MPPSLRSELPSRPLQTRPCIELTFCKAPPYGPYLGVEHLAEVGVYLCGREHVARVVTLRRVLFELLPGLLVSREKSATILTCGASGASPTSASIRHARAKCALIAPVPMSAKLTESTGSVPKPHLRKWRSACAVFWFWKWMCARPKWNRWCLSISFFFFFFFR
jgi:hypothetical protein